MCGIAGVWSPERNAIGLDALKAMTDSLQRRGPDAEGHWVDEQAGIALGHRRLSILDLSCAGSQPMVSRTGRYVLVLNGEIYNHLELRLLLSATENVAWRGHSDTETLLA